MDGVKPAAASRAARCRCLRSTARPSNWTLTHRRPDRARRRYGPDDPEPEYVSINHFNVAAVTLQENNHIVLVHLPTARVIHDFSAGAVNLDNVDTRG